MLKVVLMDLFPYLISKSHIYNFVWQNVLTSEQYETFSNNEDFSELLSKDLNEKSVSDHFLSMTNNDKSSLEIINRYYSHYDELLKEFFQEYKFQDVITKFFQDAHTSGCDVILINNDSDFNKWVELIKLPRGVSMSNDKNEVNFSNLEECLTDKSIALNEFIYFTNDESIIDHLVEKGYFCATISKNSDNSNLIAINSIEELNFGNLALNFYDKSENTTGEL